MHYVQLLNMVPLIKIIFMEIFNSISRRENRINGEINVGDTLTVPQQSLSITEIMQRSLNGIPVKTHVTSFEDNPDLDNINPTERPDFDLTDYSELSKKVGENLKKVKDAQEEAKKTAENELFKKAVDEEIQRRSEAKKLSDKETIA